MLFKARGMFTDESWYWIGNRVLVLYNILFNILYTVALVYLNPLANTKASVTEVDDTSSQELCSIKGQQDVKVQGCGDINENKKKGMLLPFKPLAMAFDTVNYFVDMPAIAAIKFEVLLELMTPFLTAKVSRQFVALDAAGLRMSTLQVVLFPILVGALLNQYCQSLFRLVSPVMPPIAVVTIAVLCGNAIAQNASAILMFGQQVVLVVCVLHASGFLCGYMLSRAFGFNVSSSRTVSIEVGMQNSVLGVVLVGQHFGNPLTVVPCAVSSVCHQSLVVFGQECGDTIHPPPLKQDLSANNY